MTRLYLSDWSDSELDGLERILGRRASIEDFLERRIDTGGVARLGLVVAGNCELFGQDTKSFLAEILDAMYVERKKAKGAMIESEKLYEENRDPRHKTDAARWKNVDKSLKVQLNAAFGVLTNQWFFMYDHRNAEAITMSGQLVIRWMEKHINSFINETLKTDDVDYIIAMDTDSLYVDFGPIVKMICEGMTDERICDFLDRLSREKIEQVIDEGYDQLARYLNAREQRMKMKRESIAKKGIWTGKKHYILSVMDEEGIRFAEPKIKIKGMAAVKSSTPSACRDRIKKSIELIMANDEEGLNRFVDEFRRIYPSLPFGDTARPSSVSNLDKWRDATLVCKSGTPIAVRAAILYNRIIEAQGLSEYPPIFDGDKIRYVYLKTPNPISQNVFGTPGPIPPSLGVRDYIDWDTMFDKTFMVPLRSILDAIGWRSNAVETGATLDDVFGEETARPARPAERPWRPESSGASLEDLFG